MDDNDLTAYHGSPHDFDQFDLSRVGSGQGEQAYGHGLYFASNEDVAKSYRDDLSSSKQLIDGRPVEDLAREGLMAKEVTPDQEIARFVNQYGRMARNAIAVNAPHLVDRYDELTSGDRLKSAGKMYEVRIKAHPESILDWDRPISEQPRILQALQEQHANLDPEHEKFQYLDFAHKNIMREGNKGSHAHYYLKQVLGNKGASDYLNGLGVKGIRYLDSGSRGVGEGSHNYVIFDDSLVNVAKKYRQGGSVEGGANQRAFGGRNKESNHVWWHGTVSGDLRGGKTGLHLGTKAAAEDALHARIGFPAEGEWDGTREYGKTLLAGRKTILARNPYGLSGRNINVPDEDYYAHEHPDGPLKYWNGDEVDQSAKPWIKPFKITGSMTNSVDRPHNDWKANGYMQAALKRGNAKSGYYYKNEGEDYGSISAVVPNGNHIVPHQENPVEVSGDETPSPQPEQKAIGGSAIAKLRQMSDSAVAQAIRAITKSGSSPRDAVTLSKRLLGRQ